MRLGDAQDRRWDDKAPERGEPDTAPPAAVKRNFRRTDPHTHPLIGRWRIVEMDLCGRDYLDMQVPAFIAFDPRGGGEFVFGLVSGSLSCGYSPHIIDFTWGGDDDGHEVFGDGWATLEDDGAVTGEIRFHGGDQSGSRAERW